MERVLGVQWYAEKDIFKFHMSLKDHPCARREILSMVSSIFDPLGFLAPLTFTVMSILQKLCRLNLAWDGNIPNVFAQTWERWLHGLQS